MTLCAPADTSPPPPCPPQLALRHLPPEEVEGLRSAFVSMDRNRSGTVSMDELRQCLREKQAFISEQQLQVGGQMELDLTGLLPCHRDVA